MTTIRLTALALLWSASTALFADTAIRDGSFTTTDGAQIHYLRAGEHTARPTLILIPGWTLTASLWREQLQRFSGSRLVIAVDSRSQGQSSRMQTGNTPERRAQDLHELAGKLHLGKLVLVGWSQGAQDAAAYIQQFGTDSVAAVAFVDSPVSAGTAELDLRKEFARAILSGLAVYAAHPADYSQGMVQSIFKRPHPDLDVADIVRIARSTPPSIGTAMLISDIFGADRRAALARIDRPALVIASAQSPLLEAQKEMAAAIQGSRLVVVDNAGHALFVDDPEKFDAALTKLLSGLR
ncbi:MAG TPA: alpha/beta hydrolase [Steroidobacteraceae bacterium]|jgi:microsomal epoxide hydrolase